MLAEALDISLCTAPERRPARFSVRTPRLLGTRQPGLAVTEGVQRNVYGLHLASFGHLRALPSARRAPVCSGVLVAPITERLAAQQHRDGGRRRGASGGGATRQRWRWPPAASAPPPPLHRLLRFAGPVRGHTYARGLGVDAQRRERATLVQRHRDASRAARRRKRIKPIVVFFKSRQVGYLF